MHAGLIGLVFLVSWALTGIILIAARRWRVVDTPNEALCMRWTQDKKQCTLNIDLKSRKSVINYVDDDGKPAQYAI